MMKVGISRLFVGALLLLLSLFLYIIIFNSRTPQKTATHLSKRTSPESRTFRMGFTSSPHDVTKEGFRQSFEFLRMNSDLMAHYFSEGIPWHEAHRNKPYHRKVEDMLDLLASNEDDHQKVFLYMTPLNVQVDNVAGYWGSETRSKWFPITLDDPGVAPSYLSFCRNLISRFKPDYMAYGIEVNTLAENQPGAWPKFLQLAQQVYSSLKADNPRLPLFVSINTNSFWKDPKRQTEIIRQILPYSDFVAVSAYPHLLSRSKPAWLQEDYFLGIRKLAPQKPFVIAETGYPAQKRTVDHRIVRGNQPIQDRYLKFVLQESQKLKAEFLVWFVHRDYDPLVKKVVAAEFSDELVELFKRRKDTGLLAHDGKKRRALQTWTHWFRLPLK